MKNLIYCLLFITLTSSLFGQLEHLENQKKIVDSLFYIDASEALKYSEATIEDARQFGDSSYITYFLDQAGELNRRQGNYDRSVELLQECIVHKKYWTDLKDLSITHNNLGRTYTNKGQYDLAAYNYLKALQLMETAKNLMGQGFYLNNLAVVYDLQHNYGKALEYYKKSLKVKEEIGNETGIAASYTNLGIVYFNLGDYNKSIEYHKRGYKIYQKLGSSTKVARTLNNLARAYLETGDYTNALKYITQANVSDTLHDNKQLSTEIQLNLAHCYFKLNELDSTKRHVDQAMQMATETNSFKNLTDVYALKAIIAEKQGDLESSLSYLKQQLSYRDSLINETNIYAVSEMEGKYEYEKNLRLIQESELAIAQKEKEIERQKLKVFYWLTACVVLIAIVLVFMLLYWFKKQNTSLLKGQLALIHSQNHNLSELNHNLKTELDRTQISLEEKNEVLNNVFAKSKETELPESLMSLSRREMEVLSHLALGWTDDQLAEKLFVSKSTIKTHLRRIYSKLTVRGRTEAVAMAHKHNLLGDMVFEKTD